MTQSQKLIGIAVIALIVGGGMGVAVQAARSPAMIARARLAEGLRVAEASKISEGSRHSCIDLKEGTFDWRWANVPFASICDAKPDAS
jgi:hypothetical protein